MSEPTITIGIDNGITGAAVVLLNGTKIHAQTPLFIQQSRKGNEQDILALDAWLYSVLTHEQLKSATFVVEEPGGSRQAFSAASMAASFHAIRTLLDLRRWRYHRITPQSWQNKLIPSNKPRKVKKKGQPEAPPVVVVTPPVEAGAEAPKKGKSEKETKVMALALANRLFPGHNWLATPRSKVPHDGLVDSALIAYHGWRERL